MCSLFWLAFASTHQDQNKDKLSFSSSLKRRILKHSAYSICMWLWDHCCSYHPWWPRAQEDWHLLFFKQKVLQPMKSFTYLSVKMVFLLPYWCESALVHCFLPHKERKMVVPLTAVPSWALEHRATKATGLWILQRSDTWSAGLYCR